MVIRNEIGNTAQEDMTEVPVKIPSSSIRELQRICDVGRAGGLYPHEFNVGDLLTHYVRTMTDQAKLECDRILDGITLP